MALFASKHIHEDTLVFDNLTGGVNYSLPQDLIAESELSSAMNFIYDPNTSRLMNRPGATRYSADGEPSGKPISGGFYSTILDVDLVASDGVLYALNGTNEFTVIDDLNGSYRPVFLDFNGKVIVASGGVLQSTDGTDLTDIANAPTSSKIMSYAGRVISAGDTTYPHRLFLSAPGDETDFDSGASGLYFDIALNSGDGITDFNILGNDIIIFKGIQQKGIYRLIVPNGDFDKAYVKEDSQVNTSINFYSSIQEGNDVFMLDTNGFKSLVTTQKYGDIEQDEAGGKINLTIAGTIDGDYSFMVRNPFYNQIWIKYSGLPYVFVYHYLLKAFLLIKFEGLTIESAWYHEDTGDFMMGMDDGYVYKLDKQSYTDNGTTVPAYFATRKFRNLTNLKSLGTLFRKLHKQTIFDYESIDDGTASLVMEIDSGGDSVNLTTVQLLSGFIMLYVATDYLNNATMPLYGVNFNTKRISKFINFYDGKFVVSVNEGALKVNRIESRIAIAGRR